MKNTIKKIAILGGVLACVLSLPGLATTAALAHGDENHGPADQKNADCHEAREPMQNGKADPKHMKGCHDQEHKKQGHTEKADHLPREGHQMGDHMKGEK